MLNKVTNLNSPFFIDDNESYPDFDFISKYNDTQIIIAQVKKGRNLKITNGKEMIKGFKTNSYLQKKENKKQLVFVA